MTHLVPDCGNLIRCRGPHNSHTHHPGMRSGRLHARGGGPRTTLAYPPSSPLAPSQRHSTVAVPASRASRGLCCGCRGTPSKEKVEHDVYPDGASGGGEEGGPSVRFLLAVSLIVMVQVGVNVLAFGGSAASLHALSDSLFATAASSSSSSTAAVGSLLAASSVSDRRAAEALIGAAAPRPRHYARLLGADGGELPRGEFLGSFFRLGALDAQILETPVFERRYATLDFAPPSTDDKMAHKWRRWSVEASSSSASAPAFPPDEVNANGFSAVFRGRFHFDAGQYRFAVGASGGMRVFVDGVLLIDEMSHMHSAMHDPLVDNRLIRLDGNAEREIWVEFSQFPSVVSREHWAPFVRADATKSAKSAPKKEESHVHRKPEGAGGVARAFGSKPAKRQYHHKHRRRRRSLLADATEAEDARATRDAGLMLGAHLHLHWLRDDFGLRIYLYELPARFNREIWETNEGCRKGSMFGAEVAMHVSLRDSAIRTFDPREADLFYVPAYTTCHYLGAPFFGIDPWFGKRMVVQAVKFVKQEFPFWRRRLGSDHIFATTYDYGACFEYKFSKAQAAGVVRELNNVILLQTISDATVSCFRPSKDVALPTYIDPHGDMVERALPPPARIPAGGGNAAAGVGGAGGAVGSGGAIALETASGADGREHRDWFVYFQGSREWVIDHDPEYSNGMRNLLFEQYGSDPLFVVREGKTPSYVDNLRRSVFCLAPRGFAVWSPRVYMSVVSGCIPVIIADGMHLPFAFKGSGIDWRDFSLMVPEERVRNGQLKDILTSLSPEAVLSKQRALRRVRQKFVFLKSVKEAFGDDDTGKTADVAGAAGAVGAAAQLRGGDGGVGDRRGEVPQGDAFEMVCLALREKARAMDYLEAKVGPGFWT